MPDHVHIYIEIPPQYAVASVIGYLWNREESALEPAYGELPYQAFGTSYRYGCGVPGHALRFGRPATWARRPRADAHSLIQPRMRDSQATSRTLDTDDSSLDRAAGGQPEQGGFRQGRRELGRLQVERAHERLELLVDG